MTEEREALGAAYLMGGPAALVAMLPGGLAALRRVVDEAVGLTGDPATCALFGVFSTAWFASCLTDALNALGLSVSVGWSRVRDSVGGILALLPEVSPASTEGSWQVRRG